MESDGTGKLSHFHGQMPMSKGRAGEVFSADELTRDRGQGPRVEGSSLQLAGHSASDSSMDKPEVGFNRAHPRQSALFLRSRASAA